MTSIQTHKTKLQPLVYSHKDIEDLEDDHVLELYDEPGEIPQSTSYKRLPTSQPMKSLKAQLYKNVVSSEGISSSEDDSSLSDLPKNQMSIKHTMDYFGTNTNNKKMPSLLRKSAEKKKPAETIEQRLFRPIMNQNIVPSVTPVEKIVEQSKEESITTERLDDQMMRSMDSNERQDSGNEKHFMKGTDLYNKENIGNNLMQAPKGRYDEVSSLRSSQSLQKKSFTHGRESINSQQVVESHQNKGMRLSGVSDLQQSRDLREILERRNVPNSKGRVLQSTTTLMTEERSRGTIDGYSDFYGRKQLEKDVYRDVLINLQSMSLDSEGSRTRINETHNSNKHEKAALALIEERLGRKYADGLFDIYVKHCTTKDSKRKSMTLGKLLLFLKNLDLLDQTVTRESVSIIFAQRCPDKFADFAGFVDILYKVHKLFDHPFHYEIVNKKDNQKPHKHQKFQAFIQERIFDKQEQLNNADDSKGSSLARLNTTESDLYSIDNLALQILEDHHEELKKTFRSYWPWNSKYQGRKSDTRKGIILQKDFKEFCYDYGLVPTLCTLGEISELFRRYQKEDEAVIDYRGFIYILCLVANIGFAKGPLKHKFDTFAKKIAKLLSYMSEVAHRTPERMNR